MKSYVLIILIAFLFLLYCNSYSQNKKFGLGFIVGEPTGLSAKLWISKSNALDFGLGWSIRRYHFYAYDPDYYGISHIHFHIDYLWHYFDALSNSGQFPLYFGAGGNIYAASGYNTVFGIRGVFGISWLPRSTPVDLFFEIVPTLIIINPSGFTIDAGLGARIYF